MTDSGSLSDRGPGNRPEAIYERPRGRASKSVAGKIGPAVTGAVAGLACALLLGELGVPHIFGYGRFVLIVPLIPAGALAAFTRWRYVMPWVALLLVAFILLLGWTNMMRGPVARLVRSDAVPARSDAIVVLSAGVTVDGFLQDQGLDRLIKGLELVRSGVSRKLVLTRERKRVRGKWVTSAGDQDRLIALAGGADVVVTGVVTSTRQEAVRVAELARRDGWKHIVLVTSPLHSRRACATFEHVGLTVSCVPSDSRDIALRNLVGRDNNVGAFGMWIYELAGTLRYWQAGWI
jgi:uncharacterized SAM-binding protein YcdF (DUF218 family)